MNMKRNTASTAVFAALLLGLAAMNSKANADDAAKKDLADKVEAAAAAIKNYSVAQKDEALNRAKATLEDLDTRIQQMEERLDQEWSQMDKAARATARDTLDKLHEQRTELDDWYGLLKQSSAAAWEQVKQGFIESYELLRSSMNKVQTGS